MKRTGTVPLPLVALIAVTRGMLGAGIGLLLAERLSPARRARVGRILMAVGAASTVPIALAVFRGGRHSSSGRPRTGWNAGE
jgi:hypothetical protein